MREKLYIIDISNFIHRAYYVHKELTTPDGFPSGAIHGTFSMLYTFIHKYSPKNILVCYDWQGEGSFRKSIYPEYKANRASVNAISAQELIIRHIIKLLGIASAEVAGYEADDVIATAVKQYKQQYDCVVVTGDKDLLQLIDDNVSMLDTMKHITYGHEEVKKKFNVQPNQISDYLAIAGDNVDNIPGVKGVGKKGASKLLEQYGDLANIYKNIDAIPGALGKKMKANQQEAFISQQLSHLYDNLNLNISKIQFTPKPNQELLDLFDKLYFVANKPKLLKLWKQYE